MDYIIYGGIGAVLGVGSAHFFPHSAPWIWFAANALAFVLLGSRGSFVLALAVGFVAARTE